MDDARIFLCVIVGRFCLHAIVGAHLPGHRQKHISSPLSEVNYRKFEVHRECRVSSSYVLDILQHIIVVLRNSRYASRIHLAGSIWCSLEAPSWQRSWKIVMNSGCHVPNTRSKASVWWRSWVSVSASEQLKASMVEHCIWIACLRVS